MAGYALLRIFIEFFRQPDAHYITPDNPAGHVIAWGGAGVTMGQALCVPMVFVGLFLVARSRR